MSYKTTVEQRWNGNEVKIKGRRVASSSSFEIGLVVEGQAVELAPRKSGRLAGSITTQSGSGEGTEVRAPAQPGDKISAPRDDRETYVGTAVEYGPYQEFGAMGRDAQPFLRPALALARGQALTIVQKEGRYHFKEYLK